MRASAGLSLGQRLALTPGMRQSLALLRLPTEDLLAELAREADENPFLRVELPAPGGGDAFQAALATTPDRPALFDSLHGQLSLMRLPAEEFRAALLIVTELREDGYLDTPLADLAAEYGLDPGALERGLAAVQRCDPPGIGARGLEECLFLQLREAGIPEAAARAAIAGLDALAEGRIAAVAQRSGIDRALLERVTALLRGLRPVPVEPQGGPVQVRIPELIAEPAGPHEVTVRLNPEALPSVSVERLYAARLGDRPEMQGLLSRADLILRGLRARGETLLRIGRHIARSQPQFFLRPEGGLLPQTRAEAAAALGIHPTTLGRAVAGKALMAGGTVWPLETFFSRALPGPEGAVSAFDLQRRIRGMVAAEPAGAPLADAEICRRLHDEGVDIARRTVAKYRKWMRIPSSFERRRRKAPQGRPPAAPTGTRSPN